MGYYTRFSLEIDDPKHREFIILKNFREECEWAHYCLQDDGSCEDEGKWYEHEDDMRNLSKRYRDALFTLQGEGEESGDLWVKYFKNGKMQECRARITYDEFDPAKLV